MDEKLEPFFDEVLRRNPGEVEFHQAAREVLGSLGPVLAKHPELAERKIIQGANIAGFQRVAHAMVALGLV